MIEGKDMPNNRLTSLWNVIKTLGLLTIGFAITVFIVFETINTIQVMRGGATTTELLPKNWTGV